VPKIKTTAIKNAFIVTSPVRQRECCQFKATTTKTRKVLRRALLDKRDSPYQCVETLVKALLCSERGYLSLGKK
jgi:hypothetical protein